MAFYSLSEISLVLITFRCISTKYLRKINILLSLIAGLINKNSYGQNSVIICQELCYLTDFIISIVNNTEYIINLLVCILLFLLSSWFCNIFEWKELLLIQLWWRVKEHFLVAHTRTLWNECYVIGFCFCLFINSFIH